VGRDFSSICPFLSQKSRPTQLVISFVTHTVMQKIILQTPGAPLLSVHYPPFCKSLFAQIKLYTKRKRIILIGLSVIKAIQTMTSYGGIIRIRLKGRSLITSSQPSILSSPTQFITNVFCRNSETPLFHNSKYFAVMETISQNSFRRLRCNEVPGICHANSYAKQGFDSGKHQKCFPTRHIHYYSVFVYYTPFCSLCQ